MALTKLTPFINVPTVQPVPPVSGYTYCPQSGPGASPNPPVTPVVPPTNSGNNGGSGSSHQCVTIYIPPVVNPNNPNQNEGSSGTYEVICP